MEQLALYEKLFVDEEVLEEDENHADLSCSDCHKGNPDDKNWKTAHNGLVKDPSYPSEGVCLDCHDIDAAKYENSMHYHTRPLVDLVLKRAGKNPEMRNHIEKAAEVHCSSCHASCGQCHVSRPAYAGGGLLSAHEFVKRPPMQEVCIACHGSRVGSEYLGKNESCQPDVHYKKAYMTCEKCHKAEQMHGDGRTYARRHDVENGPKCTECHESIYASEAAARSTHMTHKDRVSCQVCHSQSYTNCFDCHVALSKEGQPYYEIGGHSLDFKIGLNPSRSDIE